MSERSVEGTEEKLARALKDSDNLIRSAQAILSRHLEPAGGLDAKEAIGELLGLLDGPEQRRIQKATQAALGLVSP